MEFQSDLLDSQADLYNEQQEVFKMIVAITQEEYKIITSC